MDVIEQARDLKGLAMVERDVENWDDALRLLDEAKDALEQALRELKTQPGEKGAKLLEYETLVKRQLYQLLGSIGGVYRRRSASGDRQPGDLAAASKSYDDGWTIEQEFTDSYNLTQRLVTRVLLQPGAVLQESATVEGEGVRDALRRAKDTIDKQISENGPRNKDEYAFADAAIVAVLLGESPESRWREAVREFTRRAPKSSYARTATLDVLNELKARAEQDGSVPALVGRLEEAVQLVSL